MKIEVGKFYKTRDGHKVRISANDGVLSDAIHGAVLNYSCWISCNWRGGGKSSDGIENDIVSEWTEPKPKLKAWVCGIGIGAYEPGDVSFTVAPHDKLDSQIRDGYWTRAPWLDEPETT